MLGSGPEATSNVMWLQGTKAFCFYTGWYRMNITFWLQIIVHCRTFLAKQMKEATRTQPKQKIWYELKPV